MSAKPIKASKPIKYISKAKKVEAARAQKAKPIKYQSKGNSVRSPKLFIKLADLTFHPLLKRVGLLPDLIVREEKLGNAQGKSRSAHKAAAEEMTHDFFALIESVRKSGIREKLKVIKTAKGWLIVDGRHRFEAAKEVISQYGNGELLNEEKAVALATIGLPCEEITEAEVVPIIMDAVNRRHLSKGARAYLAVLMFPETARDAKERQKTGAPSAFSAEGLAREAGVSPRLIEDAIGLYHEFAAREDVRKKFESAIWVGAGLAKLRAGIKGFLATGTEPDEEPETNEQARKRLAIERVETAMQKWVGVKTAFQHWDTLTPDGKEMVTKSGVDTVLALPAFVKLSIGEALKKEAGTDA